MYHESFVMNFYQEGQNSEQNLIDLQTIITSMSDKARTVLFEICGSLIGNTFSIKVTDPKNIEFSSRYIDMDGENIGNGSTGTRLLITMVGILLNPSFEYVMIDEPELGLNPRIQSRLVNLLYDSAQRNKYFPHLRKLFIATHSHIFLNRGDIQNNYAVNKAGQTIYVKSIGNINEFYDAQFRLLGNDFESMFLPSAILLVEGPTDQLFFARILQIHFPNRRLTVVTSGGDGGIKDKLHTLGQAFGNISKSPYATRTFIILDQKNSVKISKLISQGILEDNIHVWQQNGIEYIYPKSILSKIFSCSEDKLHGLVIGDNSVSLHGITHSKKELCDLVCSSLSKNIAHHSELSALLEKIKVRIE
jgi:hypothetical protein